MKPEIEDMIQALQGEKVSFYQAKVVIDSIEELSADEKREALKRFIPADKVPPPAPEFPVRTTSVSLKMNCPRCKRALNVTEPAFGKTVPCPGCKQPIKVPHPAAVSATAPAQRASPRSGGTDNLAAESTPPQLPPPMPPPPDGYPLANDPLEFLNSESVAPSAPPRSAGGNPLLGGTIGKIASPSAFAFALFLLFLPWLTVSCQDQNGSEHKVFSQSGLQTCYAGASSDQPDVRNGKSPGEGGLGPGTRPPEPDVRNGKSPGDGIKDLSPALLMILYAAAVVTGLSLSVAVLIGNERLRRWVVACSVAAFCLLAMQMMLGFPAESWIRERSRQLTEQERHLTELVGNTMTRSDKMGLAYAVAAGESCAIIVRYTIFPWLSLLVALAPAIVAAGEEWLFRSRASRGSPHWSVTGSDRHLPPCKPKW